MLSNETPPQTHVTDNFRQTLAEIGAQRLGSALVSYERNPAPMREREAPNPNQGIHIRRIDLEKSCTLSRVSVTQECADHNSKVSAVGRPDLFAHLWGEQG
jgi:hypothetical protein